MSGSVVDRAVPRPETGAPVQPASGAAEAPAAARAWAELERGVRVALEHYANVHRGTGYNSIVTTALYEKARDIVLERLGFGRDGVALFMSPWRLHRFLAVLPIGVKYRVISSADVGLPIGLRAVALRRKDLPRGVPFQVGGGTIRMVSPNFVDWAGVPDRFEPGTPDIVGAITLAKAARMTGDLGPDVFRTRGGQALPEATAPEPDEANRRSGAELLVWLKTQLVGRNLLVPTTDGESFYTNLDHGASTPTFEPIWDAARRTWHQPEPAWPDIIAATRATCHRFFGAPASGYEVIFAPCTTEAVNIVAASVEYQALRDPDIVVLNTMLEHNSNELPWRYVPGAELVRAPVDKEGFVDLAELEEILAEYNERHRHGSKRIRLVCVCGASNVMGTYNDLAAISRIVHHYHSRLLVDAAQLAAHRPIRMQEDGIDFLAFSAHKAYAPFGTGAIICRKGLLLLDATERAEIVASGEENVAGIAALGKALELLERIGMDAIMAEEKRFTCLALAGLAGVRGVRVYGVANECSDRFPLKGGVICFEVKGVPHNLCAQLLAEHGGIGVRNGCFCVNMYVKGLLGISRAKNTFAHVGLTLAPRVMNRLMVGLVRVSFGLANDEVEVVRLVSTLARVAAEPPPLINRVLAAMHFGTLLLPRTPTGRKISEATEEALVRVYSTAPDRSD